MSQQHEKREIPMFNQDFDLGLFIFITRKNLKWVLMIFLLIGLSIFLYLRYTIPLYRSVSIIQLTDDIQQKKIFSKEDYFDNSLAQELELMRSPVFLQRTLDSMDLDITYFIKGRIIDFDNYNNGPYKVHANVHNTVIYGVPINIRFKSLTNYQLKYRVGGKLYEYDFITNKNESTEHFDIITLVRYENQLLNQQVNYYFKINDSTQFVNRFGKGIEINILNDAARTIRITTTDVNYNRAADIANGIAREFEYFNLEKKKESSNRIIEYIDRTLGLVKDKLEESDSSLANYKKRNRVVESTDFNPLANKNLDIIESFESRKLDFEIKLLLLNDIIDKVQTKDVNIYQLITLISQANIQGNVSNIVNNLNNLLIRRDQLRQSVTENSREYQELTNQIETQKKILIESVSYVKQTVVDQVNDLSRRIQLLESELFSSNNGSNTEADYMQLKRVYEVNQKYYDELISKRAEYILAREGYTPGYRVLKVAHPNPIPVFPRKYFIIAIGLLISLLLSLTVIVLNYVTHDLILSVNDITKYAYVPVLGVISKYKDNIPISQLIVDKYPKSLTSETFRTIRSNLEFITNKPGSKLISVTSTISGEGKTFVAINLAGILAYADKRVIIVDADMRKPKIHLGFNVFNEKGLSTLLIGKNKLEECIHESNMKNLHFITAGPIPPNPSELLMSSSMSKLIDELMNQYDYVLIDNPPVGIVADAYSNLKIADYPIYVFRADYSRKFFINNLNKIREEHKLDKLGIVLNGFDLRKTGKYSGYGYGYGYSGYGYGMGYGYLDKGFGYYEEDIIKSKKGFLFRFFNRNKK